MVDWQSRVMDVVDPRGAKHLEEEKNCTAVLRLPKGHQRMKVGLWPQFISSGFDNPSYQEGTKNRRLFDQFQKDVKYPEEENVQVRGRPAGTGKIYPGFPTRSYPVCITTTFRFRYIPTPTGIKNIRA